MKQQIDSLKKGVFSWHKSKLWDEIKLDGSDQRVNEFLLQARGDLLRCVGNLERAEKAIEIDEG